MDSETVRLFEEDGYLTALPIHGPEAVRGIRDQFNALENAEGKENCSIRLINRHMDIPFIWQLATDPKILDYIELLMGPDIMVLATHIFCKYEKTEKFVAWHQDVTYWGLEPPYALTAWYAIDDSVVENGCMRVIPGSHQHSIVDHGTSNNPNNLLSIGQEIKSPFEERKAVDLVLKAGEISIHHGHSVHGSNPNRSSNRRCGVTIRYTRPSVRPTDDNSIKQPWPAILVRGEDRENNFGKWDLEFLP